MIRNAELRDVNTIHKLLKIYGDRGDLLPRPLSKLYEQLRDFSVFVDDQDRILGCCALQLCWEDLAEIRSLAVHPDHVRKGIGSKLAERALAEALSFGISKVFTLTYKPGFFEKMGFHRIKRSDLPLKIWSDCILCVKFPDCDEIAMLREMGEG